MAEDDQVTDPDPVEADPPATGERPDHHNAPPGVAVPGGADTDPAGAVAGKPDDSEEPGEDREDEGLSPI
jgi:hypothetical protein